MSEQVMTSAKPQSSPAIHSGVLQRAAITPIAHGLLQRCSNGVECPECRAKREQREQQEGKLQRAAVNTAPTPAVPPIVHDVLSSPGQPLDRDTRAFMEPRFGHDFSGVRVHADARAAQSARAVNALAYTVGRDVVFGMGQYMPETMGGKRLLAHELTHVVQQNTFAFGSGMQKQLEVGTIDDMFEQEANTQASIVVASADSDTAQSEHLQSTRTPGAAMRLQKPEADTSKAPKDLPCVLSTGRPAPSGTVIQFPIESATPSSSELVGIEAYKKSWIVRGSVDDVVINGYASADGGQALNWRLSCQRAEQIKFELSKVIPKEKITTIAHGETDEFSTTRYEPNRRAIITTLPGRPPAPPTPPPPLCPSVPISTPGTCAARHTAYCEAARCFPSNPWLSCACGASADVCRAVDAFSFSGTEGTELEACIMAPPPSPFALGPTAAKAAWLLRTNAGIWGHWRAGLEALHHPSRPIPTTLTPEWASAVSICRSDGIGSKTCCQAQVVAEQNAIDHVGPYDSSLFGPLPTDVPGAPFCSFIVRRRSPGLPFTGNFGNVSDRIAYGIKRCCP